MEKLSLGGVTLEKGEGDVPKLSSASRPKAADENEQFPPLGGVAPGTRKD